MRGFSRIVCCGICRAAPASLVSDVALEPLLSREDPRKRQFPSQILSRANLEELTLSLSWASVFTALHVQFHTEFGRRSLPSPLGGGCTPRVVVYADASRRGKAFHFNLYLLAGPTACLQLGKHGPYSGESGRITGTVSVSCINVRNITAHLFKLQKNTFYPIIRYFLHTLG